MNKIIQGDCLEELKKLPDQSVNCCVTSPPYWGLRDYGVDDQIGLEQSPEEYTENMVSVFAEVKRVLKDDGTLWLNLGDSYGSGSRKTQKAQSVANGNRQDLPVERGKQGYAKQLIGIPWRVAFALQQDGWYLRQDIIWHKPNPMPESVKDRCTNSHEYVFLLAKSEKYYYDNDAIKEESKDESLARLLRGVSDNHKYSNGAGGQTVQSIARTRKNVRKQFDSSHGGGGTSFVGHSGYKKSDGTLICDGKRNKRSVWTITTKPYKGAHFATFPEDLIVPMIKAGCPKGGVVLDPFMGSGTTAYVARKLNRKYIGIELNPEYIKLCNQRLAQQTLGI